MWGSRKPGGGGGSGTPGDTHLVGLARGQPEVGAHLARAVPGIDPHWPGAGRLTFVPRFKCVFAPYARYNAAALLSQKRVHRVQQELRARAAALLLQGVRRQRHLRARAASRLLQGVRRMVL
eukprot:scaffold63298_cov60-Phaeocystis_antarctica.AAC.1